ncbi:MAG: prepilin-type N-terminal cleavage/methylation domain-containing protein [Acidimicrobiales bacterium]
MSNTLRRMQQRPDRGDLSGFTLIELLIVIVVLGILAAVVIFALGGITGKSAIASCQADGATISTAVASYNALNPGTPVTQTLLTTTPAGSPYIQSWPTAGPHFAFAISTAVNAPTGATAANQLDVSVAPAGAVTGTGTYIPYAGPSSCSAVS